MRPGVFRIPLLHAVVAGLGAAASTFLLLLEHEPATMALLKALVSGIVIAATSFGAALAVGSAEAKPPAGG